MHVTSCIHVNSFIHYSFKLIRITKNVKGKLGTFVLLNLKYNCVNYALVNILSSSKLQILKLADLVNDVLWKQIICLQQDLLQTSAVWTSTNIFYDGCDFPINLVVHISVISQMLMLLTLFKKSAAKCAQWTKTSF